MEVVASKAELILLTGAVVHASKRRSHSGCLGAGVSLRGPECKYAIQYYRQDLTRSPSAVGALP
jgi:hypothetical protein